MSAALLLILSILTKLVFAVLVGLSIWSISVILDRRKFLASVDDRDVLATLRTEILRKAALTGTAGGIRSELIKSLGTHKGNPTQQEHLFRGAVLERKAELEKGLTVLASLGSNAPFIGLFGTVLGIIQAFGTLSEGSSAMNSVMFAIAEALVATAVGLFVAIPAVLAYNTFNRRIRNILQDCESLKETYLGIQD